jgi:hypothetical protein
VRGFRPGGAPRGGACSGAPIHNHKPENTSTGQHPDRLLISFIQVDGSLSSWTYIMACLYPLHDAPALTLGGAYALLPVAHKYGFTKLVSRLLDFIKGQPC